MAAPYGWLDRLVDSGWLGRLSPSALRVLFALGRHTNGRTLESWPGIERLERLTALKRASVFAALNELQEASLVDVTTRTKPGKHRDYEVRVYMLRPVPPLPTEPQSENSDSGPRSSPVAPPIPPSVRTGSTGTDQLETDQLGSPVVQRDTPEAGNGEQSKDLDSLRPLVGDWLQTHPGHEPLRERAALCARALQSRGVQTWTRQVLEVLQSAQEGTASG